jgi:cytochrome c oxidase subunit 3
MAAQLAGKQILPAEKVATVASTDTRYRVGAWVIVASVSMLFTGLSSAYIVRAASAPDWQALAVPRVLWLSTALIFASSLSFEAARRSLRQSQVSVYSRWLCLTGALGLVFLALQLSAWRQLAGQGVYLASNPHSSFFYVLTAVHGLHLLVGLLALFVLLLRAARKGDAGAGKQMAVTDGVVVYWHFMDFLWIYLFVLLFVWKTV